jgi:hypothetical protein
MAETGAAASRWLVGQVILVGALAVARPASGQG